MAKRTRYQKRTSARNAPKRPARPSAGATAQAERPRPSVQPVDLDGTLDTFDDMPIRSSSGLTDAEIERAAQLEAEAAQLQAEATATERAAIAEALRRQRRRADERDLAARGDINAPLSVRMSHEYAYVARDVKRIALTAGLMVAILAVLAILINVLGVISV